MFLGKCVQKICNKVTYKRPMSKFEFNKVAKHFLRTPFPKSTSGRLPLRKLTNQLRDRAAFSCAIKSKIEDTKNHG